jgi:zinc transporter, ZIP family
VEARSVAEGREERARRGLARWRLWALVPLLLLVGVVSLFAARGDSLLELVGRNPPPADELDIRRVEFSPGEIRIRVTNPQREAITIATVTVDDAIVPYSVDGPRELGRLRSSTVVVPYDWVEDEPISVGVTSSTGIQTTEEIAAAVETPGPSPKGFLGYALIGALVGIVPVALGLLWLPSLRRAAPQWLAAFMALTGGLLTFLALEALAEALELQAALPGALGGVGLVLLGVATSYLALSFLAQRLSASGGSAHGGVLGGLALATLVAIGIGAHNLGEGLAIGSSFALGELTLGTFLIVGFMVHNVTEGLGIAAPVAEGARAGIGRLAVLALVAGAPTILGAWIGGYVTNDLLSVLFFAVAAGAALQVVVEVARYVARRAPGGLTSGYVVGGFLAGIAIMFVTGLLVG